MATGFDLLAQAGVQNAQNQAAHKQAMADEEHEGHIKDLLAQKDDLLKKLPTQFDENNKPTPEYQETLDALTKNTQDMREAYHPAKNPGAIEKFGHLMTDHLRITNPQEREQQVKDKQTAQHTQDQQTAQRFADTAGPSAAQQAQAASTKALADVRAALQSYDATHPNASGPNATPEEKQARQNFQTAIFNKSMGIPEKPIYKQYQLPDKTYRSYDVSHPELIPAGATEVLAGSQSADAKKRADYQAAKDKFEKENPGKEFPSYEKWVPTEAQKPSTSVPNEIAAAYAHAHGIQVSDLTPEDWSYLQRRTAMDKAIPTATTSTTYHTDANGKVYAFTATNYKTPGGNVSIEDPRGVPPQARSAGSQPNGKSKPNLKSLRKEAQDRKPKGGGASNVKISDPLMQAATPTLTKANEDVVAATKVDSLAKQALASHDPVEQRQLALGMIRGMAGRVNMQEFQQYTQKMGVENTVEGMIRGLQTGQMPDGIVNSLVKAAHANLKASQDALKAASNSGSQPSSSGGDVDIDAIVSALNAMKKK